MAGEIEEEMGEYDFLPEEYHDYLAGEIGTSSEKSCLSKWRKVPREPSFFSDCETRVSSFKESDYEAWLKQYYNDLYLEENTMTFFNKMTDTSDLEDVKIQNKSPALSIFENFEPKESTKYWGLKEQRRHWPITKSNKEYLLFPSIHPLLNVSSRYGRYLSILHTSSGMLEAEHKKRLVSIFKMNLIRAKLFSYQLAKLILYDNLVSLSWFDVVTKKVVLTTLCHLLRSQRSLEIVSFENAQLKQLEGIVLLCALSRNTGYGLRELHMWRMFAYGQCPVLRDTLSLAGRNKGNKYYSVDLKYHFMEILNNFTSLTVLSVNYSYLANQQGDALLRLKTLRCGYLKELRLLCTAEERPFLTNPQYGVGGYKIPDGVWRRAREWNPNLRVAAVFLHLPQYENIILFLSKNIPLSRFFVISGKDFKFETPWEIDTTLLELRNWYANTLETLSLHLWHHRDLLDYVIEYKILEEFPNLTKFEFIGVLKCLSTLEGFCRRLLTRKYKLKVLLFWVEESYVDKKKQKRSQERFEEIKSNYLGLLQNIGIDADFRMYPI